MPQTARRIGRYELLEIIARGAAGVVYRAEDPAINRTVAVKVLKLGAELTAGQVALARARFLREGQAAGSIDHPNIVRILDVGEDQEQGEMYIVMEYLAGGTLDGLLADGPADPVAVVRLIEQVAAGLD